ncbi:hypothetical protein LCGC14_3114650 [marine sediment metagenome]|uniref:Uncharacterized protein n=1 Tax=marine sediment metagenome TaxID=412755 RepID=A0A0F8YBH5_9ZZZZ
MAATDHHAVITAAKAASAAWESDDLSQEHTAKIMRLMWALKTAIDDAPATGAPEVTP